MARMSRYAFAATIVTIAAPTLVWAQRSDSTALPRVVITATRLDAALGSDLSATTVLNGDDLRRAGVRDVAAALRLVPGMAVVSSGGAGSQASIFLRGGESDFVRVLVDGVAVNDPGGAIDLAGLTLDNVDRIEVVRGPTSVLYGTDAVTGVVQIFTRAASGHPGIDAAARAGRYGTRVVDASTSIGGAALGATLGGAHSATTGILPFNNAYRNDVGTARLTAAPDDATRISLSARLGSDTYRYPTDGAGNVVDHNARRVGRRTVVALDATRRISSRLRGAISLSAFDAAGRTLDARDDLADTLGFYAYRGVTQLRRRVADARLHVSLSPTAVLTVGGEWTFEAQRSTDSSNYDAAPSRFHADRSNRAAYAQVLAEHGRFSYVMGARYDDNRVFGPFRTARTAVAVHPWRGGTLRAAIGGAFKAPSFFETFSSAFSIGNPGLHPERSRSWELTAGQEIAGGRFTVSSTWFDQMFRDLIQYTYQAPDLPNYFNVAAASARGLELEASGGVMDGVHVRASATLLRSRVDDAGFDTGAGATFVRGERLLRRPPLSGALEVAASQWRRATFDATLLYTGRRDDRDFSAFPALPVVLDAYTRVDIASVVPLRHASDGTAVALQIRLENVLGAGYQDVYNFPSPGRALSVGVQVGGRR